MASPGAPPAGPARRLLPQGTLAVAAGLALLGLGSYTHLAIAGHALDDAGMSTLSVLWSISLVASQGLFLPIEQELTRLVATGTARGEGIGAVVRRTAALAGVVLAVLLAALAAGGDTVADRLFAADATIVWILAASVAGYAAAHLVRGVLAGRGHLGWYGAQLGLDGAIRIVVPAALWLAGVRSPAWFCAVLIAAPALSAALTLRPALRPTGAGPSIAWRALVHGLGLLTVSALMAQLVVNMPVVNAQLLAPDEVAFAGALLSALVLVRVPIFLFASLQATLLPGLSAAVAAGDEAGYRRLLGRALGVVTVLCVPAGALAVLAGPWLIRTLFDAPDLLGPLDFALLALATLAYLAALVLGQGVLVKGRHLDQAVAWTVGGAALCAVTFGPGNVAVRVELGYLAGALVAAAGLAAALLLRRGPARPAGGVDAVPAPVAAGGPR